MKTQIYEKCLPDYAKNIRKTVFQDEQGFLNEFDETDEIATHFVMFNEDGMPIATCRVFRDDDSEAYIFGRLAVYKEYRGHNIGSLLIREAENYVRNVGGKTISLHAQCRASAFYRKSGYAEYGETDDDEGCPHIWMKKILEKE